MDLLQGQLLWHPRVWRPTLHLDARTQGSVYTGTAPEVPVSADAQAVVIRDVSGNLRHPAQADTAKRPLWYGPGLLRFDGSNDWFSGDHPDLPDEATVFAVASIAAHTSAVFALGNGGANATGIDLYVSSSSTMTLRVRESGVSRVASYAVTLPLATTIFSCRYQASTVQQIRVNGVVKANASTIAAALQSAIDTAQVGTLAGASDFHPLNGDLYSLLVYDRLFTTSQCRQVERYLSRRFNVALEG